MSHSFPIFSSSFSLCCLSKQKKVRMPSTDTKNKVEHPSVDHSNDSNPESYILWYPTHNIQKSSPSVSIERNFPSLSSKPVFTKKAVIVYLPCRSDYAEVRERDRRRQWHPTPVLLPGKSHGWRSLVVCFSLSRTGEGNGNPLQCSCLENPRDREAWWAAIYRVSQSWPRLKWLSSSSREIKADATLNKLTE